MRMYEVEISSQDGEVVIEQQGSCGEDRSCIVITKEQAEIVCKWILDAAKGEELE